MHTLYGYHAAGSLVIEAALAEIGAEYRFVHVDLENWPDLDPAFKAANPRMQVPTIRFADGTVMSESAAILLHLADLHPEAGLAPPPGTPERAALLRWLFFFAVNVYEGELRRAYADRYTTNPAGAEAVSTSADAYVRWHYTLFEQEIGAGPYFFGETVSMLDLYVWMLSFWMPDRDWLVSDCPKLHRLIETTRARPKIVPLHQAQVIDVA
ncbi:MAG: glutathione S-transferase family protein [Pseudomonadota bacterium]